MKFVTEEKDGALVVHVTGEIDHHSARFLREEIDAVARGGNFTGILLDLGDTDFMDSSGLGLILGRLRFCQERNMTFALLRPGAQILRILTLAGLEKKLEIQY